MAAQPVSCLPPRRQHAITATTVVAFHSQLRRPEATQAAELDPDILRSALQAGVTELLDAIADCPSQTDGCVLCAAAAERVAAYQGQLAALEVPR